MNKLESASAEPLDAVCQQVTRSTRSVVCIAVLLSEQLSSWDLDARVENGCSPSNDPRRVGLYVHYTNLGAFWAHLSR